VGIQPAEDETEALSAVFFTKIKDKRRADGEGRMPEVTLREFQVSQVVGVGKGAAFDHTMQFAV
jgi:hypothetical protein